MRRAIALALLACVAGCTPGKDSRVPEAVRLLDEAHDSLTGRKGMLMREIHTVEPVEDIDRAALQWFETAQFSPASMDGRATDSQLILKVRFVLK